MKKTRKQELLEAVKNNILFEPIIDQMIDLEGELEYLQSFPKLEVHPHNPAKQRETPAAKLRHKDLQQYSNIVRILMKASGIDMEEEESPLRKWLKDHGEY